MANEGERSLVKRPELLPEKLKEGGVIVGVEPSVTGSLVSMSGLALERITRERLGSPFKLPERPVYLLDPSTRRMIMITHRESFERDIDVGRKTKTSDKYGLFAEIVELDEKGKPIFTLSTSDIIFPNESYQFTHVGPNFDGFAPSYIEVEKPKEEGKEDKVEFVPWNMWLGQLQGWMNEVTIDPKETFESFVSRFEEMRRRAEFKAKEKIKQTFPEGNQGIEDKTVPMNLIITNKTIDSFLYQASIRAGLYPVITTPSELANLPPSLAERKKAGEIDFKRLRSSLNVLRYLPGYQYTTHNIAVITIDYEGLNQEHGKAELAGDFDLSHRIHEVHLWVFEQMQKRNPIFAIVGVNEPPDEEAIKQLKEHVPLKARKAEHGYYLTPLDEKEYEGLLRKLKADLLLTMFVRGGAPIVK